MGKTSIEWTDCSINPLRARLNGAGKGHYCEKVSPGCKNCYSSGFQPRLGMPQFQDQRGDAGIEHWLDVSKLEEVLRRRIPTKWFWCDMTDMFGDWVPFEHIATCFRVMALTPQHTHQVLTKRPGRAAEWFRWVASQQGDEGTLHPRAALHIAASRNGIKQGPSEWMPGPWPLPNVWLGASTEDQQRANERIPLLLRLPAAVRFISAEPLLGPIDLSESGLSLGVPLADGTRWSGTLPLLNWVITGSESGNRARPMDEAWVRSLRDQCSGAGVSFFYKQKLEGRKKVGLPLLDGRQWAEFPEARA